jgi:hypothetical protein
LNINRSQNLLTPNLQRPTFNFQWTLKWQNLVQKKHHQVRQKDNRAKSRRKSRAALEDRPNCLCYGSHLLQLPVAG